MPDSLAANPYRQTWEARLSQASKALQEKVVVRESKTAVDFSETEFSKLKDKFVTEKDPTTILAIGPFGSIYKRLIAPGLFKLNEAFEKLTNSSLNLKWLASDIQDVKESKANQDRMRQAAHKSSDAVDGRLGYMKEADLSYIPASELVRILRQAKRTADGKLTIEYQGNTHHVDLALVTSLVDTHLSYAELLAGKVPTVTEKPMVAPIDGNQIENMDSIVTDANKSYATDFFPYVACMKVLEQNPGLVKGLGKLTAIHGTCTEPGNIEPGRGWLLNQDKAGGGVFIADTAPHPVAWADYTLNWFLKNIAGSKVGVDTSAAAITAVDTYRINDEDLKKGVSRQELDEALKANPNIETHGTLNAKLNMPVDANRSLVGDNVDLYISAGKGAGGRPGSKHDHKNDKPSLGLELVFENGRVELSTGYMVGDDVVYEPYIARVPNSPTHSNPIKILDMPGSKLGYNNMLVDWLLAAKGEVTDRLRSVSQSAKNSMRLLNKTYTHIVKNNIEPIIHRLGEVLKPVNAKIAFGWVNPLVESKDHDFIKTKNF